MRTIEEEGRRIHDFITGGCEDGCPSFEADIDRAPGNRIAIMLEALRRENFAKAWKIAGGLKVAYNPEAR